MPTRLQRPLRREIELEGQPYTITISPQGARIARKGARAGHEIAWGDLLTGAAELRRDLSLSVDALGAATEPGEGEKRP